MSKQDKIEAAILLSLAVIIAVVVVALLAVARMGGGR